MDDHAGHDHAAQHQHFEGGEEHAGTVHVGHEGMMMYFHGGVKEVNNQMSKTLAAV